MNRKTTTVLGVSYVGRPMMGSLACSLWLLQQKGQHKKARALLDAHNQIRRAFGQPDIDLSGQFTTVPMEGLETVPATRPIDRAVLRTARAA